ncbi:MAG: hypothetical protein HY904_21765 [Deltaproteobacteria bacterium]|nr:hypothetical protein [Deltaproteobacteria bacterium]
MDRLAELRRPQPGRTRTRARYAVEVRGGRTEQVLVVTHDEPLVAYQLDDAKHVKWGPGVRVPESVLIGELDGVSHVVFVELKGTDDPRKGKKGKARDAEEQLDSMIRHFHPYGRAGGKPAHGDTHHDQWRDGDDVLEVMPAKEHAVVQVALFSRMRSRSEPTVKVDVVGGREVTRAAAQFSNADRNRLEQSFRALLWSAGMTPNKDLPDGDA